jgi:sec-independent protein translocase protein TatB
MEFLGIGASEFVFIILIAIIILGPKDMQKAGRTIGRWLNQLVHSEGWKIFQRTSNEIRNLPTNLMREANMEMMEAEKNLRKVLDPRPNPKISPSTPNRDPSVEPRKDLPPLNEAQNATPDESPSDNSDHPDVPGGDDSNA